MAMGSRGTCHNVEHIQFQEETLDERLWNVRDRK